MRSSINPTERRAPAGSREENAGQTAAGVGWDTHMSAMSFWIWPSLNGLSSSAGASTREMSVHQPWKVLGTSILIVGPSSGSKSSSFFSFLPKMPAMAPRRALHQYRSRPGPVGVHLLPLRKVIHFCFFSGGPGRSPSSHREKESLFHTGPLLIV